MSTTRAILRFGLAALVVIIGIGCGDKSNPGHDGGGTDGTVDVGPLPPLPVQPPFDIPTDPLAGSAVEGCDVYLAERCEAGALQRCAVYDVSGQAFDPAPDPLLHRVLLYERWYDLYHQQYGGPMTAFPMVYELLRDPALKQRTSDHMTCYLKRLERIEVINLQQNPDMLDAVLEYFTGANLQFDPGDMDFTQLDTIVMYVTRQINSLNEDTFDRSCPDELPSTPWRVLDAADSDFVLDLFELVTDMRGKEILRQSGIDHFYVVSARGGDAVHLMHLSAMAYYFTGEERYREFLYRELVESHGVEGTKQSPGMDLIEAFWMARAYGYLDTGRGSVLAWQDAGACP